MLIRLLVKVGWIVRGVRLDDHAGKKRGGLAFGPDYRKPGSQRTRAVGIGLDTAILTVWNGRTHELNQKFVDRRRV